MFYAKRQFSMQSLKEKQPTFLPCNEKGYFQQKAQQTHFTPQTQLTPPYPTGGGTSLLFRESVESARRLVFHEAEFFARTIFWACANQKIYVRSKSANAQKKVRAEFGVRAKNSASWKTGFIQGVSEKTLPSLIRDSSANDKILANVMHTI